MLQLCVNVMRVTGFRPKEQPLSYKVGCGTSLRRSWSVFGSSDHLLREAARCDEALVSSTHAVTLYGSRRVAFRVATCVPDQGELRNVGPVPSRPRTCSRANSEDAQCTVKVYSKYSEPQRTQRDHPVRKGYGCVFAAKLFLLGRGLR